MFSTATLLLAIAMVTASFAGCASDDAATDEVPTEGALVVTAAAADTAGCGDGFCGDGTVGAGEECDPPDGETCSETCQAIPGVCGDCILQPNEGCDPPDGALCDSSCQAIAGPTCGDGVLNQPSEQCEPAGTPAGNFTPACSATCELVGVSLCATCEANKCDAFYGGPGAWGCDGLTGVARTSCDALLACIRSTDCAVATNDAQACYCGTAADLACLSGMADGACKAEYEAAAGSTDPSVIAGSFTDPSSPVGLVNNQITCDADTSDGTSCTAVCPL